MEYQEIAYVFTHCILNGFVIGFIPLVFGLAISGVLKIFKKA